MEPARRMFVIRGYCGAIEGGRYFSLYLNNFPRGIRFESKVTSSYFIASRFSNFSLKLFEAGDENDSQVSCDVN